MGWFWLILSLFLGLGELLTKEFILLWLATGAFFAMIISLFHSFVYQLIGFLFLSCLLLLLFKKLMLKKGDCIRESDSLIGKEGLVIETVQKVYCDRGLVRVKGEIWRAYCDEDPLPPGTRVKVTKVLGTKLKIKK